MVAHCGNRYIGANRLHTLQAMLVGLPSCCRRNSSQSDQTGKSFLRTRERHSFLKRKPSKTKRVVRAMSPSSQKASLKSHIAFIDRKGAPGNSKLDTPETVMGCACT